MQRRYAKRNTRKAYRHLDRCMEFLLGIADIFEEQHPPEAAALRIIAQVILHAQNLLSKWYTKVWGAPPDDWYVNV